MMPIPDRDQLGMLGGVDAWQIGLIVLIIAGLGLVVFGALWDRARNRRRAAEMLAPPPRTIPQFRPDAPAPHYLSDLQARRPRADAEPTALTPEHRESIRREITGAQTVTIRAGYASRDFVTDPEPPAGPCSTSPRCWSAPTRWRASASCCPCWSS